MPEAKGPDVTREVSRREFVKGAAAAGLIVSAGDYVTPALRRMGSSRLSATQSAPPPPPPPPGPGHGFTPGFWANTSSTGSGGGVEWWDAAADQAWSANGGVGTNPFSHGTLFNSFFASHPALAGMTMLQVANGGGGPIAAQNAARHLVAAYLNASFGAYAYTPAALSGMWSTAVAGGNAALSALATLLDNTNNSWD